MRKLDNVAIVGDSGYIGSHLIKEINTKHRFNSTNINLYDQNISKKISSKISKIVFLAGDPRMYYYNDHPNECMRNNYDLIKGILQKKVKHFIYLSSVCVYSNLDDYSINKNEGWNEISTFYGLSKLLAEYEIKSNIENYCILRLSTPFGKKMVKGPLFDLMNNVTYVDLNSEYSFLHIKDIVGAIRHVLTNDITGTFNLTADSSTRLNSLVKDGSSVKIISDNLIKYDSDNKKLRETGWSQKIKVNNWWKNIKN